MSLTPALSWAASTNATQYAVAFGTTNPPAVVSSSQTATTYQPAALTAGTTYYWRIVATGRGRIDQRADLESDHGGAGSLVPVASYAFNEGTGTTTVDASGNGRTGALTNATWTTAGKYGGALSFNGSSSRVTVADAAPLHLSSAMTLEAWVNPSAHGVGELAGAHLQRRRQLLSRDCPRRTSADRRRDDRRRPGAGDEAERAARQYLDACRGDV